jgi:hypothetical protein
MVKSARPSKGRSPMTAIKARPSRVHRVGKGVLSLTSVPPKRFVQRYFIDKFKRDGNVEWEIFTIEVRGTKGGKPATTKRQMIAKVKEIIR